MKLRSTAIKPDIVKEKPFVSEGFCLDHVLSWSECTTTQMSMVNLNNENPAEN